MESRGKGKGVEEEVKEVEEVEGTEDVWCRTILHFLSVRKVGGEVSVGAPAAPGWWRDN